MLFAGRGPFLTNYPRLPKMRGDGGYQSWDIKGSPALERCSPPNGGEGVNQRVTLPSPIMALYEGEQNAEFEIALVLTPETATFFERCLIRYENDCIVVSRK